MTQSVIDLFDRVADRYDEVLPFFSELGRLVAERLPGENGGRLLDIGAGRGAIALPARDRGFAVTATDAAPRMATLLAAEGVDVAVVDAEHLPFPDATFDVVTAGLVMHLLDNPDSAVREVRRVLKPGGLFAFTTPGRVPDGFEFADGANALFAEFSRHLPPGGSMGAPFDEFESLAAAGFAGIEEADLRVEIPVDGAETLWEWFRTHGTRKFLDDLGDEHRAQFRARLLADLEARDRVVLRRYAWLYTARA
ncbi:class I SAM-dependent methyltransferase [Paractinoplanes atraurantiacus]|uniref:Ubiquinone/menaquinone biosynthesis C-methylase UbiE n=1 Tax=Paractinoplanes atraurantiacus TaxID=1036182 RepID=A0A285K0L7_9ACTN|nr:class I SAM-dependent methyltransferase [Actinoplanes atraurantiacus]SNY66115.1 Ubiquinone/menaquinone biosynthesis C-methylase UbiE [Actinoplanes atraurantiacus]